MTFYTDNEHAQLFASASEMKTLRGGDEMNKDEMDEDEMDEDEIDDEMDEDDEKDEMEEEIRSSLSHESRKRARSSCLPSLPFVSQGGNAKRAKTVLIKKREKEREKDEKLVDWYFAGYNHHDEADSSLVPGGSVDDSNQRIEREQRR